MSNFKYIASYGEWSSLYESLKNEKATAQHILESKSAAIYEATIPQTKITIPDNVKDKKTSGGSNDLSELSDELEVTLENNQIFYETAIKTIDSIPGAYFFYEGKYQQAKTNMSAMKLELFNLILAGIGNSVGIETLTDSLISDPTLLESLAIKATLDKTIKLPGDGAGKVYVDTVLKADGTYANSSSGKNLNSSYLLTGRLNSANITNWVNGTFEQYIDIENSIFSDGVFAWTTTTGTSKDSQSEEMGVLYLFTTTGTSGETSTSAGGSTPQDAAPTKSVSVPWRELDTGTGEDGKSIDSSHPVVSSLIKQIASELKPNEVITKLQLTSIAPRTWYGKQMPISTGTGEPKNVAKPNPVGWNPYDEDTYFKDTSEWGAQYRAWIRGVNLGDEITAALGGKIQKNAIEVIWKVGDVAGENMSYSIVTKTTSSAPIANTPALTKILGADSGDSSLNTPIYRYKLSFNGASIAKSIPSKLKKAIGIGKSLIAYEDLQKGNSIKYKGLGEDDKPSDKIVKTGTVELVSDNKVTIITPDGTKVTISKSRFISAEPQVKAGKEVGE
jgi:hypothetical protein